MEYVRNKLTNLGIPQRELPKIINEYLPINDRIDEGRVGEVQCNRWLANGHARQTIARGDIVLALFQYCYFPLEHHKYEPVQHGTDTSGVVYGHTESLGGCDSAAPLQVPEQAGHEHAQPPVSNQLDSQQGF